jgi:hypothetical protein
MFKSKTVFIVGAGASQEAGLPTGAQLKDAIAKKLNITYKVGIDPTSPDTGDGAIAWALVEHVKKTGVETLTPTYTTHGKFAMLCRKRFLSTILLTLTAPIPE